MYTDRLKANSEYRLEARRQLAGKWMMAVLIILITWILTQAFASRGAVGYSYENGEMVRHAASGINRLGSLLNFIIGGPISFGVATYFLKLTRESNPIIEDLFGGFKYFVNTFLLQLITWILIALWSVLLIIPGIIAALRYSMAYYIMNDNPGMGAMEAINQSKEMMRGNKGKLFMLILSFAGWFLLSLLTLGIGLLWLGAYYNTSIANFYEDLRRNYNSNNFA